MSGWGISDLPSGLSIETCHSTSMFPDRATRIWLANLQGQGKIINAQYRKLTGALERTVSLNLKMLIDLGFLRR